MKRNVSAIFVDGCVALEERKGTKMNTIVITTDSRNDFDTGSTLCC